MTTTTTPSRERRKHAAQTSKTDFGARIALRPPPEDEPDQAWCWQPERRTINQLIRDCRG